MSSEPLLQFEAKALTMIWSPPHAVPGAVQLTLFTQGLGRQVTVAVAVSVRVVAGSVKHRLENEPSATALLMYGPRQSPGEVASKLTDLVAPAAMLNGPKLTTWPFWLLKAKSPQILLSSVH